MEGITQHRAGEAIVPSGSTVLEAGDRLVVIGNEKAMKLLRAKSRKNPDGWDGRAERRESASFPLLSDIPAYIERGAVRRNSS